MADNEYQTPHRPTGEGGTGNNAPPRVPRMERSESISSVQEAVPTGTLGEGPWGPSRLHYVLPEAGELTGDEMVEARRWLTILRGRITELSEEARRQPPGEEQWYEIIDEITATSHSIDALRRIFRRN